jgi:DNA-binding transcriptional ArsR family regulator
VTTTNEEPGRTTLRDPAVLRALAHPVRLELLEHLARNADGATATECATVVGLSPSATSYHLRALSKVGMIHDAPSRGDGRERVWQASHTSYDLSTDQEVSPDEVAAQTALLEIFLARQNDKVLRFLATARDGSQEWLQQSVVVDRTLVITVSEMEQLMAGIEELTKPWSMRQRDRPPKDARIVSFQLRAFPDDSP